jgi:hypothetical protein
MSVAPKLRFVSKAPYEGRSGPTGHSGRWEGEVAVLTADGALVRLGIQVSQLASSDYTSNWWSGQRVQLFKAGDRWLLQILHVGGSMETGDEAPTEGDRWLGDAAGKVWRLLDKAETIERGALVDETGTPGHDERLVLI